MPFVRFGAEGRSDAKQRDDAVPPDTLRPPRKAARSTPKAATRVKLHERSAEASGLDRMTRVPWQLRCARLEGWSKCCQ